MKFRQHRGGLAASMETCVELADAAALVAYVRNLLSGAPYRREAGATGAVLIQRYMDTEDPRNGWPATLAVTVDGYGFVGFVDDIELLKAARVITVELPEPVKI